MRYPNFLEELQSLGPNDKERAKRLGVTTRTLTNWRRELPEPIARLMERAPHLIKALADDACPTEESQPTS